MSAATANDKPPRGYVRVPDEWTQEIAMLAARVDVPVRSVTRLVIGIGLEVLRTDDAKCAELLERMSSPAVLVQGTQTG